MTEVFKQDFYIKELATRSVTLFPERASIVRDIDDVALRPGANEIVIHGLTPTADEHSIKVEGRGSATITDMTVDLVPNPDSFWEEYPSDSEDEFSDSDTDIDSQDFESDAVKQIDKELRELNSRLAAQREKAQSSTERQSALDSFGRNFTGERTLSDELDKYLKLYPGHREELFDAHQKAHKAIFDIEKEIEKKEKERIKAAKAGTKKYLKAVARQEKERERKRKLKEKEREKRRRAREEKQAYWPKKCYRVTLYLEVSSIDTPGSTPRQSVDLKKTNGKDVASDPLSVNLSLSYITQAASWSPRYDLTLLTPSRSGSIVYRAEFKNTTSETWRDAKIILSTSQTTFQGLNDAAPHMQAWHVGLIKYYGSHTKSSFQKNSASKDAIGGGGLQSNYEVVQKQTISSQSQKPIPRANLFGVEEKVEKKRSRLGSAQQQQQSYAYAGGAPPMFGSAPPAPGAPSMSLPRPAARAASSAFGMSLFRKSAAKESASVAALDESFESEEDEEADVDLDLATLADRNDGALVFQEGVKEEFGLTTTYDVPGLRTLEPSKLARRHVIAQVDLRGVDLSYVIVPKLRAAAFLKAKIKNSSSITLLKGQAGLTLDGSFLGNAVIPRCSPEESFSLGLGVDPAIHVSYAKPTMKLSTTGFLSKEDNVVYTRNILISNTKPQAAHVDLLVLDQVPVSEDERLRITIREPRGLRAEGDSAKTGTSGANSDKASAETVTTLSRTASIRSSVIPENAAGVLAGGDKWGSAVSTLKKDGEVSWNVKLNRAQSCRLRLEYEAKVPSGETISGLD